MKSLDYRQAEKRDMPWAYALFRSSLKTHIEQTWGWDEVFQRHSFEENLPASAWQIVVCGPESIGAYCLRKEVDHLLLAMLLVSPAWQRRGIGSQIISRIKQRATEQQLPLRLSVLKRNPSYRFYDAHGFVLVDQDRDRYQYYWAPPASEN